MRIPGYSLGDHLQEGTAPGLLGDTSWDVVVLQACSCRAGAAWAGLMGSDSGSALYAADGLHASVEGAYLAALVLYSRLYDAPPTGLPGRLHLRSRSRGSVVLDDTTAAALQNAAARTLGWPEVDP